MEVATRKTSLLKVLDLIEVINVIHSRTKWGEFLFGVVYQPA